MSDNENEKATTAETVETTDEQSEKKPHPLADKLITDLRMKVALKQLDAFSENDLLTLMHVLSDKTNPYVVESVNEMWQNISVDELNFNHSAVLFAYDWVYEHSAEYVQLVYLANISAELLHIPDPILRMMYVQNRIIALMDDRDKLNMFLSVLGHEIAENGDLKLQPELSDNDKKFVQLAARVVTHKIQNLQRLIAEMEAHHFKASHEMHKRFQIVPIVEGYEESFAKLVGEIALKRGYMSEKTAQQMNDLIDKFKNTDNPLDMLVHLGKTLRDLINSDNHSEEYVPESDLEA